MIKQKEKYYCIECNGCGNWEHLPIDEQRHHVQSFTYFPKADIFVCDICGNEIKEYDILERRMVE